MCVYVCCVYVVVCVLCVVMCVLCVLRVVIIGVVCCYADQTR